MTGGWWCWTVPASSNNQPQLHRAQAAWCNLTHTHDLHHSTTTSHNQHQNTPLTSTITQPPLHAQSTPQNLHLQLFINLLSNDPMITIKYSRCNRMCSLCSVHIDGPTVPYLANGTQIQCQSVNPWFFHSLTDVDSVDCRRLASNLSTNHRARASVTQGRVSGPLSGGGPSLVFLQLTRPRKCQTPALQPSSCGT